MITAWAVYGIGLAVLLALAARAVEETMEAWGLATRWAWAAAAVGAVAAPAALRWDLVGRALRRAGELVAAGGGATVPEAAAPEVVGLLGSAAPAGAAGWPELLHFPVADRGVLAAWALGSALVLAGAARAWWRMRRGRRAWPSLRIDGTEVRVSTGTGPAVSGVLDPVIVVPRRILDLPADERRLVIRHEREHREARDPALLALGLAALAACPWNPALWWTVRRLRLAVERDCDRRVIEAGADPGAYRSVLLAEAGGRSSPLPTAALGRGRSHLEARIRSLTSGPPRFRTLRSAAAVAVAAGLLFVACDAPTPQDPGAEGNGPDARSVASSAGEALDGDRPRFVPRDVDPRAVNDREIRDLLRERYPLRLKDAGVDGSVLVWLYVDRSGTVDRARIQESSGHEAMDRAALEVARQMEFEPARSGGRPVAVWVSRRITFRSEADPTATGATNRAPGEADRDDVIRIRGNTTLGLSSLPLVFLDGERLEDRAVLDDLDPDDIASIEVIKGPAAERLYGEEAADGVIRITTKDGG